MQALGETLLEQLEALSVPELVAVVLAIAYLLLAIRQNIWCWACAAVSTAIYVYLFVTAKLYMESMLNVFYFGMAVYGYSVWRRGGEAQTELPVTVWPVRVHAAAIAAVILLSAGTGFLFDRYTDAVYPYLDAMTTYAAIWTTFLVARKVLENWWYWLVIDAGSILLYLSRDLYLTSLLFVVYLAMIPFGIVAWKRSMREHAHA
ncbi:MAG: nicotinamide riboside transporter PnuC [Woeseiaceae bacterium]|nr:nicotinamide riboside transporter PnuC [Woeseiaceae bacterium]